MLFCLFCEELLNLIFKYVPFFQTNRYSRSVYFVQHIQYVKTRYPDCNYNLFLMNKKVISVILLSILALGGLFYTTSTGNSDQQLFDQWSQKLGLSFDSVELTYRFKIFQQNLEKIQTHNSKLNKGHEAGINQFAFLTEEQFRAKYLSSFEIPTQKIVVEDTPVNGPVVDWVTYGAVSPVKDQGSCAGSYAFSAGGAIEGVSAIFYKTQQQYSVQQVLDCSQAYGNNGCVNGRMDYTFTYVKDRGINTWNVYPFTGVQGPCKTNSGLFKIAGYANVTDCTTLANALTIRPISVAVDANNFQFYKSGVFYNCGTNLSLGVLLVGMADGFWVLKNAWGTTWGEQGYIRIARGNTCGVCQVGSYPIVN